MEEAGPLELKEKTEPIHAWRLVSLAPMRDERTITAP